ncbi:ubiquitin-hydrolase Zn-finger-containing protein [Actinocorallia herbida]|uniref:Ubiquitin-hydrolase Zn-finger-containing protein n=2 Tax=Actinocorallia herbida TaxID=58109 RepID=A0A3N1CSM5_9ACTN|nr:UBP-type zinc finger domain-containing protein [Actinocorallia herbida]ROO84309.1 ubiquitin-hydrolase Zn-finger-containing protein [Actinocorallia herbida]
MGQTCTHLDQIAADASPSSDGCEDCLRSGGRWVHLRMCRTCGHVGCCDSSPAKHATAHFHESAHPLISSYEPGEDWAWCYVDNTGFHVQGLKDFSHP